MISLSVFVHTVLSCPCYFILWLLLVSSSSSSCHCWPSPSPSPSGRRPWPDSVPPLPAGACSSRGPESRRKRVGTRPRTGLFCCRPEIHWFRVTWSPWPVIHMAKTGPSSTGDTERGHGAAASHGKPRTWWILLRDLKGKDASPVANPPLSHVHLVLVF